MMKNFLFAFLILSWSWATAQDADCSFGLVLNSSQATVGELISVDVTTRQFHDIAAMQYSHQWNPDHLQFEGIDYADDSPVTEFSFNLSTEDTDAGFLRLAFTDNTLQGIDFPDNSTLYSLRFTYLLAGETQVETNGEHLAIEIVNTTPETIDDYYFIHATVSDQSSSFPSFNTACIIGETCDGAASGSINIETNTSESLSFLWQNDIGYNATTEDINELSSGVYSLVTTHPDGLQLQGDFYVSQVGGLSIQLAVDNDECGGDADGAISSTVSGGSGNYAYLWSNGSTTSSIANLEGGAYSVTVTDADLGCSGTKQATVENNSTFWISVQTVDATCNNTANGSIDLSVDAPASYAPFAYEWSNGSTTEDIANLAAGFYTVSITASNGCSTEYGVFVLHQNLDTPTATITPVDCQGNAGGSISLNINAEDYSIVWSNGATTATITGLAAGDYSVILTELASNCSLEATYTVNSGDILTGFSILCEAENTQLQLVVWNPIDAPYTFEWSTGDVTTDDMISTIYVDNDGTFSVTVTSASGCTHIAEDLVVNCTNATINLSLTPPYSEVENGSSFCLDVTAEEFTTQLAFQFSLEWDESLLTFNEVTNFGFSNMSTSNFGLTLTDDGFLSVSWLASDVVIGESLPADATLFSICFDAIATAETNTTVQFSSTPTPIEFIKSGNIVETVNTQNAQIGLNGGGTGNGGDLELTVDNATTYQGGLICVPVTSSGFSNLTGLQFSLSWDPEGLEFNSIQNINIPNSNLTNFGSIDEAQSDGILRFLWVDNDVSGEYIQPGVSLFEVCFIAHGEAGNYPIEFSDLPIPAQAINGDIEEVQIITIPGNIEILGQIGDEPISFGISSGAVDIGQSICLPIYVIDMEQLTAMQFSINWDQGLVTFNTIEVLDNLPGLNVSNFHTPEPGVLTFSWLSPTLEAISLAEGTPLFELCFTANQAEGVAGVTFSNQPTPFEFIRGTESIGFTPVNGQVVISMDDLVWPGDTDISTNVDHFDLLNIGLAFGAEGASRNNASINWLAQHANLWEGETPSSAINFRHMDTDGNGLVNEEDILALEQNWGETTDGFGGSAGDSRELEIIAVPFYIQPDTVQAGAQVILPIILGTDDTAVEATYGVAFSIHYDPTLVRPGSAQVIFDGWMGNEENDLVGVYRDYHALGRIDIALVRTNGENEGGSGQIASFGIIMEDVVFRDFVDLELLVRIENVRLINILEEVLPTTMPETVILVEGLTNNREALELQALSIHPNPTTGSFTINHPNIDIQSIFVFDARGQLNIVLDVDNASIDLLPAGVYWLQFQTDKGVAYRKIIKL